MLAPHYNHITAHQAERYHYLDLFSQATLVRNTTDENEARILYEYLAEASVVFPKVFPVM